MLNVASCSGESNGRRFFSSFCNRPLDMPFALTLLNGTSLVYTPTNCMSRGRGRWLGGTVRRRCAFVIVRDKSNPARMRFPTGGFSENPTFRELLQSPGDIFSLRRNRQCNHGIWSPPRTADRFLLDDIDQIPRTVSKLGVFEMTLPTSLNYPIIAIADLHGQLDQLKRLVARLEEVSEWDDCALVFLGDFVDRGEDVPGTIDLVHELLSRRPGGSAILGNHDLALVRAARLDDVPPSPYWIESYLHRYDHDQTFLGYLGRSPNHRGDHWEEDLEELRFIRRKRAPNLKKADMLIPIEVAFKDSKPGGHHVHQLVVSRLRHPRLPVHPHRL